MRDGVNPSSCWLPEGPWPTMLHFLCAQFPAIEKALWLIRLRADEVIDSNHTIINEHTPYRSGIHLFYYRELPPEIPVPFLEEILFHNEHLIVVDKPHFLPVIPFRQVPATNPAGTPEKYTRHQHTNTHTQDR
jgi:tRNA pseudouridine32 synthase / 23S rRNA pseudouridine746 synthase